MEPYSVETETGLLVQKSIIEDAKQQFINGNTATKNAFGLEEAGRASSAPWRVKRHGEICSSQLSVLLQRRRVAGHPRLLIRTQTA